MQKARLVKRADVNEQESFVENSEPKRREEQPAIQAKVSSLVEWVKQSQQRLAESSGGPSARKKFDALFAQP